MTLEKKPTNTNHMKKSELKSEILAEKKLI